MTLGKAIAVGRFWGGGGFSAYVRGQTVSRDFPTTQPEPSNHLRPAQETLS